MKKIFKSLVVFVLTRQVRKLRKKNSFRVIAVVGSIGKTSTKLAIAQTLEPNLRVRYQHGNYNDLVTVPLIFFGQNTPSLMNPFAWFRVFRNNHKQIKDFEYDVVVLEIGTDGPGQIAKFSRYGQIDVAVITAITPEHMEYFSDIQAVANEELAITQFSSQIIYNSDLVATEYIQTLPDGAISYAMHDAESQFHLANIFHSANGLEADIKNSGEVFLHIAHEVVSEVQLYSVLASVAVGNIVGLKKTQILNGITNIKPVSGRLRRLRGVNNSLIIDDTYNSSPEAVKAGLGMLYQLESPQKIAVLGNMNELGSISETAHKEVGDLCDPKQLSLIITIGQDANNFLATSAEANGCTVKKFEDPYSIGEFLQTKIEPNAIIFAKGSQNGVFLEEAIKKVLADPEDANKLVRQSDYWLKIKEMQFLGTSK